MNFDVNAQLSGAEVNEFGRKLVEHEKKIAKKIGEKLSDAQMKLSEVEAELTAVQEYAQKKIEELQIVSTEFINMQGTVSRTQARVVDLESLLQKYRDLLEAQNIADPFRAEEAEAADQPKTPLN